MSVEKIYAEWRKQYHGELVAPYVETIRCEGQPPCSGHGHTVLHWSLRSAVMPTWAALAADERQKWTEAIESIHPELTVSMQ